MLQVPHQDRAFLAERAAPAKGEEGETVPFVQIVSRIARGIDPAEAFAPPLADKTGATEAPEAATEDEDEAAIAETIEAATAPEVESGDAVVADLLDEIVEDQEEEAESP